MRTRSLRNAFVGLALVLASTGCGTAGSVIADTAPGGSPTGGSSSSEEPGGNREPITPGGIAAIVLQHLGSEAVGKFVVYEPEPGSVSVTIQLRDSTQHNFAVQVSSPEQAELFRAARQCRREPKRTGAPQCRTLANGTTVTTTVDDVGFSDDNVEGMVITGAVVTPEDGAALVMYESYDDSPAVSVADLEDLLTDPRLTWLTDPVVNKAGKDIDMTESTS